MVGFRHPGKSVPWRRGNDRPPSENKSLGTSPPSGREEFPRPGASPARQSSLGFGPFHLDFGVLEIEAMASPCGPGASCFLSAINPNRAPALSPGRDSPLSRQCAFHGTSFFPTPTGPRKTPGPRPIHRPHNKNVGNFHGLPPCESRARSTGGLRLFGASEHGTSPKLPWVGPPGTNHGRRLVPRPHPSGSFCGIQGKRFA